MQSFPLQENELATQPIIYAIRVPTEYVRYGNFAPPDEVLR
jgi:hypothetical protein